MFGDFFVTLFSFVIVLGLLLFFHELGHFVMARLANIEVEEFGFGFPPRLVKLFTWRGTEFTLNWIPFGAFVRPKGENDPEVPGGLASASPWVRLGVFFGGPFMNLLVGIILFTVMFMRIGAPDTRTVQIMDIAPSSPAEQAGLQAGDVIVSVNGEIIDSTERLHELIQANLGKEVALEYQRGSQVNKVQLVPRKEPPADQGPIGIAMGNPFVPVTLNQAVPAALDTTWEQVRQFALLPVRILRGEANPEETRVVGPKGIFDIYSEFRQRDIEAASSPADLPAVNVLMFTATISVALGLTNLLPIPALDGGRILFIIPEILFRRRVPAEYENLVHLIGLAALLLLMGWITIQDFTNPILMP